MELKEVRVDELEDEDGELGGSSVCSLTARGQITPYHTSTRGRVCAALHAESPQRVDLGMFVLLGQ